MITTKRYFASILINSNVVTIYFLVILSLGFRQSAAMAEGQPRAVAPVDCKECARQFPTFKVYIKHLLAKECGAAQSQRPSIKVIIIWRRPVLLITLLITG